MQHRTVHRFVDPHTRAPLLPVQQQARAAFRVTRRQVQRAGAFLALFLLSFVVFNYHRHYEAWQKPSLSSCPDRLAALGINLNAAPSDLHQFATSSSTDGEHKQQTLERHQVYQQMSAGLKKQGLTLGGVVTQGITQDELFKRTEPAGKWTKPQLQPVMHQLQVPVRAVVLPLTDHAAATQIHTAVRHALQQLISDDSVWYQDVDLMHSTLYHSSTYRHPVPATDVQIQEEQAAVARVAGQFCPIWAALDRVVITNTGVVVACWQVLPGSSEPAAVRAALKTALPNAPPAGQQAVAEPTIMHMTVARLLGPAKLPVIGQMAQSNRQVWDMRYMQQALIEVEADLSDELCGVSAYFEEVWYVEEHTLLALGLGGKYAKRASQLRCPAKINT